MAETEKLEQSGEASESTFTKGEEWIVKGDGSQVKIGSVLENTQLGASIYEYESGDKIVNPATGEIRWEVFGTAQGGMGKVYFVYDREWRVDLAVKSFIPPSDAMIRQKIEIARHHKLPLPNKSEIVENLSRSFLRESRAWLDLSGHPNVCSGYYTLPLGGTNRFFIEYVEGGSLSAVLSDIFDPAKELSPVERLADVLDYAIQFANGMAYVHARAILHRDIKPDNCLVAMDGTLKITDFGLIMKNGEEYKAFRRKQKGHPENPLSTRELEKKFRNAAKMTITEKNIEMLIEKIKSIEHVADIREIVDLLH